MNEIEEMKKINQELIAIYQENIELLVLIRDELAKISNKLNKKDTNEKSN